MNRREFLMCVGASLIPHIIRVSPVLGTLEYMGPVPTFLLDGKLYYVKDYIHANTLYLIPSGFHKVAITPEQIAYELLNKFRTDP